MHGVPSTTVSSVLYSIEHGKFDRVLRASESRDHHSCKWRKHHCLFLSSASSAAVRISLCLFALSFLNSFAATNPSKKNKVMVVMNAHGMSIPPTPTRSVMICLNKTVLLKETLAKESKELRPINKKMCTLWLPTLQKMSLRMVQNYYWGVALFTNMQKMFNQMAPVPNTMRNYY